MQRKDVQLTSSSNWSPVPSKQSTSVRAVCAGGMISGTAADSILDVARFVPSTNGSVIVGEVDRVEGFPEGTVTELSKCGVSDIVFVGYV